MGADDDDLAAPAAGTAERHFEVAYSVTVDAEHLLPDGVAEPGQRTLDVACGIFKLARMAGVVFFPCNPCHVLTQAAR